MTTNPMTPERLEELRSWLSTACPPGIYGEMLAEIDRLRAVVVAIDAIQKSSKDRYITKALMDILEVIHQAKKGAK